MFPTEQDRPSPAFAVVDATSPGAVTAMRRYVEELFDRLPHGFTVEDALAGAAVAFNPPQGYYLLAGPAEDPLAGGAITFLDDERAEVKRMWVSPAARGTGLAGTLLARLEELAAQAGRSTMVLDTNSALVRAVGLYERHGYRRVEAYNDNADADVWFAKKLAGRSS